MYKRKLKVSKNHKNVMKISTGVIIGQLISIITLPIIARLYGPEIIGIWAFLFALTRIINSFSDLGLTHTLMVQDGNEIKNTFPVINTSNFLLSFIASLFIILYYYLINSEMNLLYLFLIMSIFIFTNKQIQINYTWLNRTEHYGALLMNPIIHSLAYGILAIVFGLIGFISYGYFVAHLMGQVITLIFMIRYIPLRKFTFRISEFKAVIYSNSRFVKYQMPANVISSFKNEIPTIIINIFWGPVVLGYYSIVVKILKMPSTLLANSIGKVFFQTISKMKRSGQLFGEYVTRNITFAYRVGIIPIVILIASGDIIVSIFLGSEWTEAGIMLQLLALQFFFMFIINTIQGLSTVLDKQNLAMISSTMQVLGYIVGALLGEYLFGSYLVGLGLMGLIYIIIHIWYVSLLIKHLGMSTLKYYLTTGKYILATLIISVFIRFVVVNNIINLFI